MSRSQVIEDRVLALKNKFSKKNFDFVFEKTKFIYINVVTKFFKTRKDNIYEVIAEAESFVWQTILNYDPSKKASFTTYLYSSTFWSLNTNYSRKKRKEALYSNISEESVFLSESEEAITQFFEQEEKDKKKFLIEKVKYFAIKYSDKRIEKILDIRYGKYQDKVTPFAEIAKEMGTTHQTIFNIFTKFCLLIKEELKSNYA